METSTDVCSVALHENGSLIAHRLHKAAKSHSELLPGIVPEICEEAKTTLQALDAVAVSGGPGSYTGLRIGISTAKGFAYSLKIPVIAVPTMDVMLEAVRGKFKGAFFLCAMMDARRMEVYIKVEDQDGIEIREAQPKILDAESFGEFVELGYFFGNGMPKFREITEKTNFIFIDDIFSEARNMGRMAFEKFQSGRFEDTARFEPDYLKEWQTTTPKKKLI